MSINASTIKVGDILVHVSSYPLYYKVTKVSTKTFEQESLQNSTQFINKCIKYTDMIVNSLKISTPETEACILELKKESEEREAKRNEEKATIAKDVANYMRSLINSMSDDELVVLYKKNEYNKGFERGLTKYMI